MNVNIKLNIENSEERGKSEILSLQKPLLQPVAETFGDYISKFSQFGDYISKFGQISK